MNPKTKIEIVKENTMQYAIYIDNELYTRVGSYYTAQKIKKKLKFVYNN